MFDNNKLDLRHKNFSKDQLSILSIGFSKTDLLKNVRVSILMNKGRSTILREMDTQKFYSKFLSNKGAHPRKNKNEGNTVT